MAKKQRAWSDTESVVRERIIEPHNWADSEKIIKVLREVPSVRGMVYGNLAEVQLWEWLEHQDGIDPAKMSRDDDHAKTKADITFDYQGRRYTIQSKSIQTNKIRDDGSGGFTAEIQCDGSDKRTITLPTGRQVSTTLYLAGEFDVLATALHPFTGDWTFAFRLNRTLPPTAHHSYSDEERAVLLKSLVPIEFPLRPASDWTTDLFGLLESEKDLGAGVADDDGKTAVRAPTGQLAIIE